MCVLLSTCLSFQSKQNKTEIEPFFLFYTSIQHLKKQVLLEIRRDGITISISPNFLQIVKNFTIICFLSAEWMYKIEKMALCFILLRLK